MKINLCVPTRGKSDYLARFTAETLANSVLPGTRIVVGFDEDDPTVKDAMKALPWDDKVICSVESREDALGAKYNRCAAVYPADIYIMGVDDVAIATPRWDLILVDAMRRSFKDDIGCVYFGYEPHGECYPSMQAVTHKLVELMGFFVIPHFPYWWGNTTLDEIVQFAGCVVRDDRIETRYPERFPATRKKDLAFWAWFFDETRILRAAIAENVLTARDIPDAHKHLLRVARPALVQEFMHRNSLLRDPRMSKRILRLDDPAVDVVDDPNRKEPIDERHARLRDQALRVIESLAE